jgi:hypothetical protein
MKNAKTKKQNAARIFSWTLISLVLVAAFIIAILFAVPNSANPRRNVIPRPDRIQVITTGRPDFPWETTGSPGGTLNFLASSTPGSDEHKNFNAIFSGWNRSIGYSVGYGIFEGRWFRDSFEIMTELDEYAMEDAEDDAEEIFRTKRFYRQEFLQVTVGTHGGRMIVFRYDEHRSFTFDKNEPAKVYNLIYIFTRDTTHLAGNLAEYQIYFADTVRMTPGHIDGEDYYAVGFTGIGRLTDTWNAIRDL